MSRTYTLGTIALALTISAGCKQAGDDFDDATPDTTALTMEVTGDSASEGLSTASADWGESEQALAPQGNVPEYLRHTRDAVRALNEAVASILRPILEAIAAQGKQAQVGDTRVFGPHDRGSATFKFIIKKVAFRSFGWALIGKPKGADDSAYVPVMGGAIQVGDVAHQGHGVMGADLDKLAMVDASFKGAGQLLVGFAHVAGFKILNYGLHNFSPDVSAHDPIDAVFSGWRGPGGGTRVRLAVHGNVADSPTDAAELLLLRARWLPGLGGRADAIATQGDVPAGHAIIANSCWDRDLNGGASGFLVVRDCDRATAACTVLRTEGALANCARGLDTEELPPESPTDPTLESGAPEAPSIPTSMPTMP